jgi:outer membrane protein assembly factor BamB
MRNKTVFLLALILLLGSLLTACGNQSLASTDWPGLTVKDDMAYLAAGTYVYAINLANGQELTITQGSETTPVRFPADGRGGPFYGDPAFTSEGQMIIGSANINDRKHPLFSASAEDFTTNWTFENQAKDIWLAGALILNDTIYMPNSDGGLYAFDMNGNIKGKFVAEHALWSNPVTDGETIYVASMDHNVYAVNPGNMNQIWKTELDASITASPTVVDGTMYIATIGGTVYALDAATGQIIWQNNFEGGVSDHVVAAGDRLYLGLLYQDTGTIYALNAEDGSVVWSYDAGGAVTASPLVTDEMLVFVTETGTVRALDLDAKPLWMQTIDAKLYSTPIAAGDLILVAPMGKQDMMLVAYDTTGALKWIFTPVKK